MAALLGTSSVGVVPVRIAGASLPQWQPRSLGSRSLASVGVHNDAEFPCPTGAGVACAWGARARLGAAARGLRQPDLSLASGGQLGELAPLAQMQDSAQRTPALKAFGVDRAVAALRLRPVQEDAYGRLFQIGSRESPSAFVFVEDRVVDPDGSALTHWISVPPHVTTAHEAVAWTFGMTDAAYQPTRET